MSFRRHWMIWAMVVIAGVGLGCNRGRSQTGQARTINVFAAASLSESFGQIARKFEAKHAGTRVVLNFAGSQQLRQQMAHGAPVDVFASANWKEMEGAIADGLVQRPAAKVFARNRLVVIYPAGNPGKIGSLADLGKRGIKLDVADPAVPVGKYTVQMLEAMAKDPAYGPGFKDRVLRNVVSREDNVKAVVAKVRLGEADAGVVYVTDAGKELGVIQVPGAYNQVAEYPIAVTARATQASEAQGFVDFVLSKEGEAILKNGGFAPGSEAWESAE